MEMESPESHQHIDDVVVGGGGVIQDEAKLQPQSKLPMSKTFGASGDKAVGGSHAFGGGVGERKAERELGRGKKILISIYTSLSLSLSPSPLPHFT